MDIKIIEEYGRNIHERHSKLRKEILQSIPDNKIQQRNAVIRILNKSSRALVDYTKQIVCTFL